MEKTKLLHGAAGWRLGAEISPGCMQVGNEVQVEAQERARSCSLSEDYRRSVIVTE